MTLILLYSYTRFHLNLPPAGRVTSASAYLLLSFIYLLPQSPPPSGELEGASYSYLRASTEFLVAARQLTAPLIP